MPFWYGDILPGGTELTGMLNVHSSVFFRKSFTVADPAAIGGLILSAKCDDGFVVWINGVEVARYNVAATSPAFSGVATASVAEPPPVIAYPLPDPSTYLLAGTNTLAVMGFNQALGSSDFGLDMTLATTSADADTPVIASIAPVPGSTIGSLDQITVVFSEAVRGVSADDLFIGQSATASVTGSGKTWTFVPAPTANGPVNVTFNPAHAISDSATPSHAFDHTASNATWSYMLLDTQAPAVAQLNPPAGATIVSLTQVEVTFSEAVTGVNPGDLLVNGVPAAGMTNPLAGKYVFTFPSQPAGIVNAQWAAAHGIADMAGNGFAGGSWSYTVNPAALTGGVRINEFMSGNQNGLKDEENEAQDWIELHNPTASAVDLTGWSLSDDANNPDQWIFPARTLGAGQYLVIFCSGKDRRGTTGNLHTNFGLSSPGGEFLALYNNQSPRALVSGFSPAFPDQRNDTSYGVDSQAVWRYYTAPTPGAANGASTISGVTEEVDFTVKRGFFNAPFSLYLSCPTAGATIRYTTDGSAPTAGTGLLYSGPIAVNTTTCVRAAGFTAGNISSRVRTSSYVFPASVRTQSTAPAGLPATWGPAGNQVIADYEVDPNVTGNALYNATFESDLLAVPSMSIVMKQDDMFGPNGINSNPGGSGIAWERAASLELIFPNGSDGFQQDCGMRIQGGYGRTPAILKHSFRPLFKGDYGESKLKFPLFPGSPVQEFDTFTLRSGMNNSYVLSTGEAARATFTEDEWMRQTQRAMGQVSGYGGFFHLYINGLYWGLYNATERPSAPFAADHFGGDKSEWDALNSSEAVDGLKTAWTTLQTLCSTGANARYITDQADWNAVMQYLDVDNLIDYMLLNFYGGNSDWDDHNWYSARRRVAGAGYKFFAWDGERTLESGNADRTGVNQADKPSRIYAALRGSPTVPINSANVEFRVRFADRVQKHLFNNGPLTPGDALNRWNGVEALIDRAVVGESARWGDKLKEPPYTRNVEFLTEVARKRTSQFPGRTASTLTQLRSAKLYPPATLAAPSFGQFGGKVARGYGLAITSTSPGTIYYTLDGSDPRQAWTAASSGGSAVDWSGGIAAGAQLYAAAIPLNGSAVVKARLRDAGGLWSALTEATFQVGEAGIPLRFTEVMYNPDGGDSYEFLEIENTGTTTADLSLMTLEGVSFTFLRGATLAAGARLVLASDVAPGLWATRYPGVTPAGYFNGKLANNGETIALKDAGGNVVTSFGYGPADPWPATANGGGRSLELVDFSANPSFPTSWRASTVANGTPGAANQPLVQPAVGFNELLSRNSGAVNNGGAVADYVELFNSGATDVDLGGWSVRVQGFLTGACIFPANTTIVAGGYLVVWAGAVPSGFQAGLSLLDDGGLVTLNDSMGTTVDAVHYGNQIVNKSIGRAGAEWVLTEPSPGSVNTASPVAAVSQLAINEIYPQTAGFPYRFIELMNRDTSLPVPLNGLYLQAGSSVQQIRSVGFIAPSSQLAILPNDLTIPVSNGVIALLDPNARTINSFTYTTAALGASFGRLPNGTGAVTTFINNPTPNAENAQISYGGPLLNEVMARNEGVVLDANGNWPDWIEFFNAGAGAFDMSGMSLALDAIAATRWVFPAGSVVPAGGYHRIWCDASRPANATNTGAALNDRGGGVWLFNAAKQQVDAIDYGPQAANLSFGNAGAQWQLLASPTPGAANSGVATFASAAGLRINEWMAVPAGSGDWVELYNSASLPVDLSGLYLTDDPSLAGRTNTAIRSRSFVAGLGTVLFSATGNIADAPNATNFQLAKEGESLRLYSSALALLDGVDFGPGTSGVSRGRYPDGTATFINFTTTASPDASNYLDSDGDGLPDAWEQANGLNPFFNDAAEDPDKDGRVNALEYLAGTDPRSGSSVLASSASAAAGGGFAVNFTAQIGKTYTVQWKDALSEPTWKKLSDVPSGAARNVEVVDSQVAGKARFYRVVTPRQP
ncbi:MAG: hypothetical protein JWL90_256 [Chthoniobacteraceae bacterium]|nr:hypothetical protein [Chthoniobacteraceae bacterium]